ncbi:malto-oligosyltrehalose synthase [Nocardioides sp. GXZ039]|uniref:malto-oligosyltrehalose synthase n=1 Tax=Nocardioides sp. GXZ039 TaxID=3136018 RepID=UPI0030F4A022
MRAPTNTYRLQIRSSFDLHEAARRLPYLHDLGVDWVYLSPLLEAEPGSDHGYDVIAHDRIDPARGGREGFEAFVAEARRLGLGVLVDIVPNHVGVATPRENAWWWDLLDHGRASRYAEAFDVDWAFGGDRVRVPVVGDDDAGSIQRDADGVRYHDHAYPPGDGFELVSWREADHDLNWRRFFAVTTLAGVRVEVPWVFEETHAEIGRWFAEGLVDGLRVDHPDGLRDPRGYLDDLARLTGDSYVLVEKILEPGEELPASWATAGTTGYDALGLIDRVLTDPAAEHALPGSDLDYEALVHDTKRAVADGILGSEVRRVVRELPPLDLPGETLVDAVAELAACFPVYRSYLPEGREHVEAAFARARSLRPDLGPALDAVEPVLTDAGQPAAIRFEQTTGAVMAKGVEDCAFYRYNRLTSLNEVGGDPAHFSLSVDDFHRAMAHRQSTRPQAMTALSTHDTKRGEDVRARIGVLAEMPEVWTDALARLQAAAPIPSEAFAALLWQAVLGAWVPQDPDLRARLHGYAEKAMREAGDHTTWTAPDADFETTVHAAVDAAFDDPAVRTVLEEVLDRVTQAGWSNALAAKALALTVPGVPDVYQGSELWEQSLVDPDNRRPVDFDLRADLLAEPARTHPARAKLDLTAAALRLRRDRPELFTGYTPVPVSGEAAAHVVAFDRGGAITVATRLPVGLAGRGGWGDTELRLPPGRWRDVLTGRESAGRLSELLDTHPVALLTREEDPR